MLIELMRGEWAIFGGWYFSRGLLGVCNVFVSQKFPPKILTPIPVTSVCLLDSWISVLNQGHSPLFSENIDANFNQIQ